MSANSHEKTLIGVDVGGSGVRATVFRRSSDRFRWHCVEVNQGPHGSLGLAPSILAVIEPLLSAPRSKASKEGTLLIGIAAPGRKTGDLRGIEAARNLPAAPRLLDELAQEFCRRGIPQAELGPHLSSDAEAALWGETCVHGGALPNAHRALFFGVGTGLAEACLWDGALMSSPGPRAATLEPILADGLFRDREDELSLSSLGRVWRKDMTGPVNQSTIESAAQAGDRRALALLERFARALADLISLRLEQLELDPDQPVLVLVRTRRGKFMQSSLVRSAVLPLLREAARRGGAQLVEPAQPFSPYAACAGALDLALGMQPNAADSTA